MLSDEVLFRNTETSFELVVLQCGNRGMLNEEEETRVKNEEW